MRRLLLIAGPFMVAVAAIEAAFVPGAVVGTVLGWGFGGIAARLAADLPGVR